MIAFLALLMAWGFSLGCCCINDPEISEESCFDCNPNTTPLYHQVTFDNVENDNCGNCNLLNTTTYVLPQLGGGGADNCWWVYTGSVLPCHADSDEGLCKIILAAAAAAYQVNVIRNDFGDCNTGEALQSPPEGPGDFHDCNKFSYTGAEMFNSAFAVNCKWSTASTHATVNVTAI